jgi:hypothetical protein
MPELVMPSIYLSLSISLDNFCPTVPDLSAKMWRCCVMIIQQATVKYLVIKCSASTYFSGILHHVLVTVFFFLNYFLLLHVDLPYPT